MSRALKAGRQTLLSLLCVAFAAWAVDPDLAHLPKVMSVLEDHAQMVAEHGHSHGFEEDLAWALHGHPHDHADHDHGTELLVEGHEVAQLSSHPEVRPASRPRDGPRPIFRHERPPRA